MTKPGDYYLGMSEFFSVLMPGFITVSAISIYFDIIKDNNLGINEWIVVMLASYILGHVLFALGSYWDEIYELCKPSGNEILLDKVERIRGELPDRDCSKINKYKWSKAVLTSKNMEGFNEVLRKEANSKLFRTMIVPLLVASLGIYEKAGIVWALIIVLVALVSFWRYRAQRFKACTVAYTHVIVLHHIEEIFNKK